MTGLMAPVLPKPQTPNPKPLWWQPFKRYHLFPFKFSSHSNPQHEVTRKVNKSLYLSCVSFKDVNWLARMREWFHDLDLVMLASDFNLHVVN